MSDENKISKDKLLERFEFFFIGLIFTVLGASIQTADFSNASNVAIITELISWTCFLVSGLFGLNKLEWLPSMVWVRDKVSNRKKIKNQLNIMSRQSSNVFIPETNEYESIEKLIEANATTIEKYDETLEDLAKKHKMKNSIQRWSFYIAFVLIAFSRAYDHVQNIL